MKWFVAGVLGMFVCGLAITARAAEGDAPKGCEEAIKKFDKDGDGKLSEAEKAEAQKAGGAVRLALATEFPSGRSSNLIRTGTAN